jgi:hypothetical protein
MAGLLVADAGVVAYIVTMVLNCAAIIGAAAWLERALPAHVNRPPFSDPHGTISPQPPVARTV